MITELDFLEHHFITTVITPNNHNNQIYDNTLENACFESLG